MKYNIEEYTEKYVVGYTKYSGIKITELEEGLCVGEMPFDENHLNPIGTVHGGAVFTLADSIGGIATRTTGIHPTTCQSTISYLRPTWNTSKLIATARVIKSGANTAVADITVTNDKGVHVSHVLATYFNLKSE